MACAHREERSETKRMCNPCGAAYMREWRKTAKGQETTHRHTEKWRGSEGLAAKAWVMARVRSGMLPKPSTLICLDCNGDAQVYDHRDYAKPWLVFPVCRRCNAARGPAKNAPKGVPCRLA